MDRQQFQAVMNISAQEVEKWFLAIDRAMCEFSIHALTDKAMFLAQTGHESGNFRYLTESLNYSPEALIVIFNKRITRQQAMMLGRTDEHPARQDAIANLVYAGRMGNRYAEDGWKYRGRGLIQITGRYQYLECGKALGLDLLTSPELLTEPLIAARSAAWFYSRSGCLTYPGDVKKITQIINGGSLGLDDRCRRFNFALQILKS